jgi:antitoxin CptB
MSINTTDLKKKIIYRSTYRGTKEMDTLLTSFTKKYIDTFNDIELINLCDLLDIDDENLYKLNQGEKTLFKIEVNKVTELFKNFVFKNE